MTRIDFRELRLMLGPHRALDGVTGAIESVTAVIGPSGAGKSSLLKVIAGLVAADAGELRFDDEDVTHQPAERRNLGVVFQDLRLFDFMSARDNVAFGPRVKKLAPEELRRRVSDALELTRSERFADRPARVLSGGERQRIALARAIAMQPRALLLDEPFSALDAELRREMRDELRALIRRLALTTLLVTHDREDAFALASRFIVLRDGRVEQAGDAGELYLRPKSEFVARLLGEATLLPRDGGRVLDQPLDISGSGTRVVVRPESVELAASGCPASLVDARFSGASWRLVLRLPSGQELVALADRPPVEPFYVRLKSPLSSV